MLYVYRYCQASHPFPYPSLPVPCPWTDITGTGNATPPHGVPL